jgi:hypothetical protein
LAKWVDHLRVVRWADLRPVVRWEDRHLVHRAARRLVSAAFLRVDLVARRQDSVVPAARPRDSADLVVRRQDSVVPAARPRDSADRVGLAVRRRRNHERMILRRAADRKASAALWFC